jgi:hypothetical protein
MVPALRRMSSMDEQINTPATPIGPWQREDGWPKPDYFQAVADALTARGVPIDEWSIEEGWEAVYLVGDHDTDEPQWTVAWRCGQDDEPLTGGFTGLSWYRTDGNNVWGFDGMGHLEDPEAVAAEIAAWWFSEVSPALRG